MTLKKAMGRILILIAVILMSAMAGVGIVSLVTSIVLPELISGDYIIHLTYRSIPLFTVIVLFAVFVGVFIKKDKSFFQ